MKMLLRSKFHVPYGSHFRLDLPKQGMVGIGSDFAQLLTSCSAWRKANGLPVGLHFEDELETEVCRHYPNECTMDTTNLPQPKGTIDGSVIASGSRVLLEHILNGRQLVSQEEANQRAAICMKCPWRVSMRHGCGGPCGAIVAIISATASKDTVPPLGNYSCGICRCFLKAAAFLPLEVQCVGIDAQTKAEFSQVQVAYPECWKRC